MRTVMDVDRDLLVEAQQVLGQPSLTATINEALRLAVQERRDTRARSRRAFFDRMAGLDDEQVAAIQAARAGHREEAA